jgi:hypothetical protein
VYLFGRSVRAVAAEGRGDVVRQLLAESEAAEPSLEDVFVSLARKRVRAKEAVAA